MKSLQNLKLMKSFRQFLGDRTKLKKEKEKKMSDYFPAGTLVRICHFLINLIIFLRTKREVEREKRERLCERGKKRGRERK